MNIKRPSPEEILEDIKQAEKKSTKGKLKIFFGFAAGVGKTYTMLEAAHNALKEGRDVVVGYVERHARPETLALLKGLEILPTKKIVYKNITFEEFDIDAALKRKPDLILVDELAHTNVAGSRNKKRYQDVEELLKAGIDVYTTVNVQHLESLNDLVGAITKIAVSERIPDKIFDEADQVEVVDIEPNELITRLEEGKIYRKNQALRALQNFFTTDNLEALREIALRRTVERLSQKAKAAKKNTNAVKAGEHILVCISGSPSNPRVIRSAARMAKAFQSSFTALVVENSTIKHASPESSRRLQENMKLAEQLGAQVTTVFGDDLPTQIAEYAKISGVTKIVMGRTNHKRNFWAGKTIVDRLAPLVGNIDIYIIPDNQPKYSMKYDWNRWLEESFDLISLLKMAVVIGICTLLGYVSDSMGFKEANIITVYLVGVLFVSLWTYGYLYGVLSALCSVLAFNYFFTDPRFTLNVYEPSYILTFIVMIIASVLMSGVALRAKKQEKAAARKAYFTELLLRSNKKLQAGKDDAEILSLGAQQLSLLLNRPIYYARNREHHALEFKVYPASREGEVLAHMTVQEQGVADWVVRNNSSAGATTNTFSHSSMLFYAVRGMQEVVAVIAIPVDRYPEISVSERNLMTAMITECGIIMERQALRISTEKIKLETEQERLRGNLLRSISHDLRTPLTSISGYANMLLEKNLPLTEAEKGTIYNDIYDDAMWLINLTENLLAITKIEEGKIPITLEAEVVSDVIEEALRHVDRKIAEHHLEIIDEDNLVMAKMDGALITQVIINIVNNAVKYTPKNSHIVIRTREDKENVIVSVEDDGPGIKPEEKKHLFDMFYIGGTSGMSPDRRRGMGLGLHLCQAIIRAHGSELYVADNDPKGTIFSFKLQREEVPTDDEGNNFSS